MSPEVEEEIIDDLTARLGDRETAEETLSIVFDHLGQEAGDVSKGEYS